MQEIVGRQQYKLLSANLQQAKGGSGTATAASKTSSSSTAPAARAAATAIAAVTSAKGVAVAGTKTAGGGGDAAAKKQATGVAGKVGGPALAAAKTKPVTSTSFAAIAAAGSDSSLVLGFGGSLMAAPPVGGLPLATLSGKQQQPASIASTLSAQAAAAKAGAATATTNQAVAPAGISASRKREDLMAGPAVAAGANNSTILPPSSLDNSNDFSPFKAFSSMSAAQGFGWGGPQSAMTAAGTTMAGPKGFAQQVAASQPDLSKAPGYNRGGGGLLPASNSPVLGPPISGIGAWSSSSVIISSPLTTATVTSAFRKPSGDTSLATASSGTAATSSSSGGGLYPTQERCNSAPGTPVSPLIPSPIAPPVLTAGSNKTTNSSTTSPIIGEATATAATDWRSSHLLHQPLPHHQHLGNRGPGSTSNLLRSLTPDADFVGGGGSSWLHADESDAGRGGSSRQGTGSYGHNSPAKSANNVSSASPILPPDLFSGGSSNKPLDSVAVANLQNMAAQLNSLPGNQFDLLTAPHHHHHHHLPPLPDMAAVSAASSYGSFNRFSGGLSRFSAPPISSSGGITSTAAAATTAFGLQQPLMSGMPHNKGLNPYATEFSHGGVGAPRGLGNRMGSGPPPPMQQQLPHHVHHHQAKVSGSSSNSAYSGYGTAGSHHFGGGGGSMNNFQTNILTNQGINAYLSQLGGGGQQQQPLDISGLGVGLADLNLSGRTLSELTDILGGGVSGGGSVPDSQYPGSLLVGGDQPVLMEPKGLFSRPIGAERRTAGPSPIGGGGGMSAASANRTNKMVDPYAVWEFPPSYMENLNAAAAAAAATDVSGFSGLISSLSGQTLASMESLMGGGGQFNGGLHHGGGGHHHHGLGGVHAPVGSFGMPSSSSGGGGGATLTPSKQQQQAPDYSDWGTGSTSGSAPGSANKNNHVTGFYERGDTASVRRNIVSRK